MCDQIAHKDVCMHCNGFKECKQGCICCNGITGCVGWSEFMCATASWRVMYRARLSSNWQDGGFARDHAVNHRKRVRYFVRCCFLKCASTGLQALCRVRFFFYWRDSGFGRVRTVPQMGSKRMWRWDGSDVSWGSPLYSLATVLLWGARWRWQQSIMRVCTVPFATGFQMGSNSSWPQNRNKLNFIWIDRCRRCPQRARRN